jgi:DNA segregation ATPase FtsK/SpoIIIE, S-DNA-T family
VSPTTSKACSKAAPDDDGGDAGRVVSNGEKDPMYDQAVDRFEKPQGQHLLVQRHLKIGYNRAARLVEDMEKAGLVSPPGLNDPHE